MIAIPVKIKGDVSGEAGSAGGAGSHLRHLDGEPRRRWRRRGGRTGPWARLTLSRTSESVGGLDLVRLGAALLTSLHLCFLVTLPLFNLYF